MNQQFLKGDLGNRLNISRENIRVTTDESQINIALIQRVLKEQIDEQAI